MPDVRDVPVTSLLLDFENPRLAEGPGSQVETIHAMLRAEGVKTLALAASIAKEGLSPIDRLMVMPSSDDASRYVVLEGNRRVTVLKILAEPTLAESVLSAAQLKRLRHWSDAYQARGETARVTCVVFGNRDEASVWIERRHRGDLGGLGVVRWGATEAARFDARRTGKYAPELQVLDYVSEHASLDAVTRNKLHNVPITNLKRLISDKAVRDKIGLDIGPNGRIQTRYPPTETLKPLTRIIRDLADEEVKVRDIYSAKDRQKYLNKFAARDLPASSKALPQSKPLVGDSGQQERASGGQGVRRARTPSRSRATLIPSSCSLHIPVPKLADIFRELRKLKLEDFPNAISVLLRVFVELSVDHALGREKLMTETQTSGSKLRDKLHKVASHLESTGQLTKKQANAVKKTAQDQLLLNTSVTTFHQYVHNEHFSASATDLRASWNNLQLFMEAVWQTEPA